MHLIHSRIVNIVPTPDMHADRVAVAHTLRQSRVSAVKRLSQLQFLTNRLRNSLKISLTCPVSFEIGITPDAKHVWIKRRTARSNVRAPVVWQDSLRQVPELSQDRL